MQRTVLREINESDEDWGLKEMKLDVKTRNKVRPDRNVVSRFRLC
jgi:hypothetical protein